MNKQENYDTQYETRSPTQLQYDEPMEQFDNYPEYLLRSYRIARWDGGRLPQFNNDYNHIIGDDPIIKSAYEQLQIYVGVIAGTIASITNLNE